MMSNKSPLATILKVETNTTLPDEIHYRIQFKGCPLNCIWCNSPALKSKKIEIVPNETICVHCMACVSDCPSTGIINLNNQIHIQSKYCIGCMSCVEICPQGALKPIGKKVSIVSLLNQLLPKKPSNNQNKKKLRITLSGGEILSQSTFLLALLKQLKEHFFFTICETTGYAKPDDFKKLLSYTDLLHFSLAHYNSQKHFEMTGVSNEIILKNLSTALYTHKNITICIPIVQMVNDDLEDAKKFADLLTRLGVNRIKIKYFKKCGFETYLPLLPSDITTSQAHQKILTYIETLKKEGLEYSF